MRMIYRMALVALLVAACGNSAKSNPDEPAPAKPAAPANLALHGEAGETFLTFQWDAATGATSYNWTISKDGTQVQSGSVSTRNKKVTGLEKATEYVFEVASVAGDYVSAKSSVTARTAGEVTPPSPARVDYADFLIPADEDKDGKALAFPGAQGGGMYTTGGRGGRIVHVTNLNDSGEGSLRWAIGLKEPRIIVFDVAGTIELTKQLTIGKDNGNVTIAGQTAPGDGICIKNHNFRINASNVIIRYIRCRMGDVLKVENDAMNAYTGDNDLENIIVDHCSLSWSIDECGSFYGITNFTLQWSILSESLRNSVHSKKAHGYGGIWGGENATYHHNLLAHHDSRNARIDHDYVSTLKGPVSMVNNVIYNWGSNTTYGGESFNGTEAKKYNIINNYYKSGPATGSGKIRFIDPTTSCSNCSGIVPGDVVPGRFYMAGNVMDSNTDKGAEMTADNWNGGSTVDASKVKSANKFSYPALPSSLSVHNAEDAYKAVLEYCGASLSRDAVDARIAKETKERSYTYTGSNGSTGGLIDSQNDVGGWPVYSGTRITDTDRDGIPDDIEESWGLDKNNADDGAAIDIDTKGRYTNLEMYLHWLVKDIVAGQNANATYTNL